MRIAITGGRNHRLGVAEWDALQYAWAALGGTTLLHGNCPDPRDLPGFSVDQQVARWAERRGVEVVPFDADWSAHGKAAGPIRNGQMVRTADALIAFTGGRGTADCARQARTAGVPVYMVADDGAVTLIGRPPVSSPPQEPAP